MAAVNVVATPTKIAQLINVTGVTVGGFVGDNSAYVTTTCAIADRELHCWGANGNGQIGNGSADTSPHTTPTKIANLTADVDAWEELTLSVDRPA